MAVNRYTAQVWEASEATWATDQRIYDENDLLFSLDNKVFKRGDGLHRYSELPEIGGGEAAAAWGSITGTLSSQTDLQNALTAKAAEADLTAHTGNTGNPHGVTKAQVGLSNVDNTSDADKPVSAATQAALATKVTTPTPLIAGVVLGTTLSTNVLGMVGYSQTPVGDKLAMYNFGGQLKTATPADDNDAATKSYVDTAIAGVGGGISTVSGTSPTLTFGNVPANSFIDLGFNVTGAAIGDSVALGVPGAAQVDGVIFTPVVSNTNVITVRCANITTSPVTVPGGEYKATVFKI